MTERAAYLGQVVRASVVFSAFLLGAAILAAHLFSLQFNEETRSFYTAIVDRHWHSYEFPKGKRGEIYFRDGLLLAGNRKVAEVVVDPGRVSQIDRVSSELGALLHQRPESLQQRIEAFTGHGLVVARALPVSLALDIDRQHLGGVYTRYYYERFYPQGDRGAAVTVGFVGPQPVHRGGLECWFDKVLAGTDGKVVYRKDASRKRLPGSVLECRPKSDGESLTTTLDQAVQVICEDEVRRAVSRTQAKWGCILVMDPKTGGVLGAATSPTFDPNEYVQGRIGQESNPLTQLVFEPGSTVKPLVAAYALERGWLDPTECFVCNRELTIDGKPLREAEAGHFVGGNDGVPIRDIIVRSSNVGMARVALSLGQDRVFDCYRAMGFFEKTGIELPAESKGRHPCQDEERRVNGRVSWPRRTVACSGFGQGLSVTPLQLTRAFCVIANGGYLVRPTLVLDQAEAHAQQMRPQTQCLPAGEKVMDADRGAPGGAASLLAGQVARAAEEPEGVPAHQMTTKDLLGERVLSEKTCEQVRRWLADVVQDSHGTGKGARLERCTAAGKTGTAQVPSPYGGYLAGTYTASFCGFFPAEAPQMVVLVVLGRPKGQYYGGQVAAPVFKAVCDRISYLDQVVLGGSGNAA